MYQRVARSVVGIDPEMGMGPASPGQATDIPPVDREGETASIGLSSNEACAASAPELKISCRSLHDAHLATRDILVRSPVVTGMRFAL